MKTLTRPNKTLQKKKIRPCTIRKRNMILAAYRKTKGSITDIAKTVGISRQRVYEIFEDFPKLREEIDSIDETMVEGLQETALVSLKKNVKAGLQSAIEFSFVKKPRKERGKIEINKDEIAGPSIELYLGVRQEVIIE